MARMYTAISTFLVKLVCQSLGTISEPLCVKGTGRWHWVWGRANFRCGSSGAWESRCAQFVRREFSCGAKLLSAKWLSVRPHSTKSNQHAGNDRKTILHKETPCAHKTLWMLLPTSRSCGLVPTTLFGWCPLLPFSQRRRSCNLPVMTE